MLIFCCVAALFAPFAHGSADPLTPEEREWLNNHKTTLTVNHNTVWPPILFIDGKGKPSGI